MSNAFSSSAFGATGGGSDATKLPLTGGTLTGALINSTNGALSSPAFALTGTPITGGTATTTKPLALIEPVGATSTAWSTSGTMLGVNAASGFVGHLFSAQVNGAELARIDSAGRGRFSGGNFNVPWVSTQGGAVGLGAGSPSVLQFITNNTEFAALDPGSFQVGANHSISWATTANVGNISSFRTRLLSPSSDTIQLGANHATTAANQTIKAHNVTTGTGADLCLKGGTGSVANGVVSFGVRSAIGAETITGFITIKDESGAVRKLAVVS
jgi:hypothetical protein